MPTLNEAQRIRAALESAVRRADEVIVADAGSTDDTISLCRELGATVIEHAGNGMGAQRNAAIAVARNEWVLAIDADEVVPGALWDEIARVVAQPSHRAYRVRMRNFYLGRERTRGRWGRDWHLRLFTRDHRFDTERVHEGLRHDGSSGSLENALLHTPYRDLGHHLTKMNTYARWGAEELRSKGRRASVSDLTVRPWWRFVRDYVFHGSMFDGTYGLVMSMLTAYSAFLKYAHLWAMDREDRRRA